MVLGNEISTETVILEKTRQHYNHSANLDLMQFDGRRFRFVCWDAQNNHFHNLPQRYYRYLKIKIKCHRIKFQQKLHF